MRFISILVILFSLSTNPALGQHQPRTSQFFMNAPAVNPAFTGIDDFWEIKTGFRQQWTGLENSPSSYFLGVYGVIKKPDPLSFQESSLRVSDPGIYAQPDLSKGMRHGVGLIVSMDQQPVIDQRLILLNYALHLSISSKLNLTLGTSFGLFNREIDVSELTVKQLNDQTYQNLIDMGARQNFLDVNLGLLLYGRQFYFGASAMPIVNSALSGSDAIEDESSEIGINVMTGYQFNISPDWRLQTSALVKYDQLNDMNYEVGVKFRKYDVFWTGLSYNSNDAVIFILGTMIKDKVSLGYSYDFLMSDLGEARRGSHEVILGFSLFKSRRSQPYAW